MKGGKRLAFEFLSIVVAVALAMGLTEWRQNVLNRQQSNISFDNILEEIEENFEELAGDSLEILQSIDGIALWLRTDKNLRDTVSMEVGFDYSFLSSSAWEVAKLNQSLTFLDNQQVLDLSQVYEAQEFYEQSGQIIFQEMSDMIKINDKSSPEYESELRSLRFNMRLTYGAVAAYLGIAKTVLERYPRSSD